MDEYAGMPGTSLTPPACVELYKMVREYFVQSRDAEVEDASKYGLHARLSTDNYANEICADNDDGSARVQLAINPLLKRYLQAAPAENFALMYQSPFMVKVAILPTCSCPRL